MYDFTNKAIKCETWEQMLHLAELACNDYLIVGNLDKTDRELFDRGFNVFCEADKHWSNYKRGEPNEIEISYHDFIASAQKQAA